MEQKVQETVAVHSAELEHIKKDMDHLMAKVDKMDTQIDRIDKTLAELNGGRKVAFWLFGAFSAIIATVVNWMLNR